MDGRLNAPTPAESVTTAILTLPNVITMVRLALVPVYLWLVFARHSYPSAAVLLGILGATDWVDGQLARRLGQVSEFGKILDPVADRILVITAVVSVTWVGAVPLWFALATILREVLVSAAVLVLASLGAKRIDVLYIGKMGAFGLMFAYPAFLLGHGTAHWQHVFVIVGWAFGISGLVFAWIAAFSYVGPARQALKLGRAGRAANRDHQGT